MSKPDDKPNNPNDLFFRAIFQFMEEALAFIKAFFPPEFVSRMDTSFFELDTTSYLDDELKAFYSDLSYRSRLLTKELLRINILVEHKGHPPHPKFPEHVQIATYKTGIWRLDFKQNRRPTFVFPVLLYHGKRPYNKRPFWKIFKKLPLEWRKWVDDIQFIVIDLNKYTDEEIIAKLGHTIIGSALLAMKHAHEPEYFFSNLEKIINFGWEKYSEEMKIRFIKILLSYLEKITNMKASELIKKAENVPSEWKDMMFVTIESVFNEGMTAEAERKNRAFVISLIQNCPDFSNEKIALIAAVPIVFVRKMKAELIAGKAAPTNGKPTPPTKTRRRNTQK